MPTSAVSPHSGKPSGVKVSGPQMTLWWPTLSSSGSREDIACSTAVFTVHCTKLVKTGIKDGFVLLPNDSMRFVTSR